MALQHLFGAAVEPLDRAVGLRRLWRCQAMLSFERPAERVKLVLARRGTLVQAEQPVSEFLAVIGQNGADTDRAGTLQITRKPPRIGRSPCREEVDEDPAVALSMVTKR